MKEIAIIICTWNKKEYVLKCIESVLNSSYKNYDLYVVDNASDDGTSESIRELYPTQVNLIENQVNKGGSGGFNTGMRTALEKDYKFLYLLDNDVIIHENALLELHAYMEQNSEVGIAGSRIYLMDNPDYLQEIGSTIDWDTFWVKLHYHGYIEDEESFPKFIECDVVPACSLLARVEAVRKIGLMDEGCFLYWDDIEWCYRMKLSGYRVVGVSASKVWHKKGITTRTDTLIGYYDWRNRANFFMKYCSESKLELFAEGILEELVQSMYFGHIKGRYSSMKTWMIALEDAIAGMRGKALEGRIYEKEQVQFPLQNIVSKLQGQIAILLDDIETDSYIPQVKHIIGQMLKYNPSLDISIVLNNSQTHYNWAVKQSEGINILENQDYDASAYSFICRFIPHISLFHKSYEKNENIDLYIDPYQNVVYTEEDKNYSLNYPQVLEMFRKVQLPVLIQRMKEATEQIKGDL